VGEIRAARRMEADSVECKRRAGCGETGTVSRRRHRPPRVLMQCSCQRRLREPTGRAVATQARPVVPRSRLAVRTATHPRNGGDQCTTNTQPATFRPQRNRRSKLTHRKLCSRFTAVRPSTRGPPIGGRRRRQPSVAAAVGRGRPQGRCGGDIPRCAPTTCLRSQPGGGGNHEEQRYCQTATKQADGVDRGEVRSVRRHTDRRSISHQGILHGGSKWTARRQSAVARENGSQTYKRLYGSDAGRAERTVDLRVQPPDGRQPDGKPPDGKPPPSSAAKSHQAERAAGCPQGRHPLRSARGTCARATAENC